MSTQTVNLYISIPSCRDWKVNFGASMIGLVRHLSGKIDFEVGILHGSSVLPRARQLAIDHARKLGHTHILFIDDDMKFPPQIVDGMLKRDVDIVACNYVSKATGKTTAHGLNGNPVEALHGLQEIGWAGFGLILIRIEAIKDIPSPLFEVRWLNEKADYIGEDFYFCGKVRAHGVKIYCDHDASKLISHIGDHAYGLAVLSVAEAA